MSTVFNGQFNTSSDFQKEHAIGMRSGEPDLKYLNQLLYGTNPRIGQPHSCIPILKTKSQVFEANSPLAIPRLIPQKQVKSDLSLVETSPQCKSHEISVRSSPKTKRSFEAVSGSKERKIARKIVVSPMKVCHPKNIKKQRKKGQAQIAQ